MIKSHRTSNFATELKIGNHVITADVKADLGGQDLGPDPHEILEAALGACTTITVQMYANRKGWKLESCDTEIKFFKEDKEGIVISRKVTFTGELDDEQKARLLEIANKCPIHNVLERGVKIQSTRVAE